MMNTNLFLILTIATVCSAGPGLIDLDNVTCEIDYMIYDGHPYHYFDSNQMNKQYLLIDLNRTNTECFTKCYNVSDELLSQISDETQPYTWLYYLREHIGDNIYNTTMEDFCKRDTICCGDIQYADFNIVYKSWTPPGPISSPGLLDYDDVITCDTNYSVIGEQRLLIDFNRNYTECFNKCYHMSDELLQMVPIKNSKITWGYFRQLVREYMYNVTKEEFCGRDDICCSDFYYRGFKLVNVHSLSKSQGISTAIIVIIISIISICICSEKRGYP